MADPHSALERLQHAGESVAYALEGPLRTHYPGFLFGFPLRKHAVPIFNYHEVTAEALEPDLDYLRENGYTTLCLHEFMQATQGGVHRRRAVLLTFDDAWSSF